MWLRMLHIWFDACYSIVEYAFMSKFYLCSNVCMFYDLIDFKPNIVLISKTCPSMTNTYTTIVLYTKSFDNQISRVSKYFLPQNDSTCPPLCQTYLVWGPGNIRPSHRTYLVTRTYPVLQPDMSGTQAARYIKGVPAPSNPNTFTSSPLHLLRLKGGSSTKSLGFLRDSSPLPLVFSKP
jgi:hypothetical protein